MSKVLGLDAVIAIHLAGVEQAAQTQAIQGGGEHIPGVTHDDTWGMGSHDAHP